VAGLEDKTDVFGAWANQFSEGSPSYAAGLRFDIPLGNRASQARLTRSRWELSRSLLEFQQTTEIAFTEVEVAVREVQSTFDETVAKKQAIDAAGREVDYLRQRWELLPDPNESAVLLIENLLDAQERLADEERAFVTAQVAYAMSWVQLRKSMGMLLRLEDPDYRALVASLPAEGVSTNPDSSTAGTVTR
jgi:outer membrane protein TolC